MSVEVRTRVEARSAGGMRAVACAGLVAAAACGATGEAATPPPSQLSVSVVDTLRSPSGYAVGKPVWVTADPARRLVVADQSDKALKLFDAAGRATGSVGRPGSGPGEFTVLLGGGALGDSLYAYDFNRTLFTVFTAQGKYVRSFPVGVAGEAMPAMARVVDDSLVLAVGFPVGAHQRDLLRLLRRDGKPVASFFNLSAYFTPENPDLIQASIPYADAAGGSVFAGVMGVDSVYAFDYHGRRVGAGAITLPHGQVQRFRPLIDANGGRRMRADRSLVYDGALALVAVVALDATHAVLQVMPLEYGSDGRLDRSAGGTYLLATLDPNTGQITTGAARELEGGLVGRDGQGALVARYVDDDFDAIELLRLRLGANPREGR